MKKHVSIGVLLMVFLILPAGPSMADEHTLVITMHALTEEGTAEQIGTVTVSETPYGLLFAPDLKGLPPGLRGFHLHENADCGPKEEDGRMVPGKAAGGHYDPQGTDSHEGPFGQGHLGDLPVLYVDADGRATLPVLAPRLEELSDLQGLALMVHEGSDNYADEPKPDGGGGKRIACGDVPE
jgi:superoxide dismutase, Cu-Zn family